MKMLSVLVMTGCIETSREKYVQQEKPYVSASVFIEDVGEIRVKLNLTQDLVDRIENQVIALTKLKIGASEIA